MKVWHVVLIILVVLGLGWFFRPQLQPAVEARLAAYEEPAEESEEAAAEAAVAEEAPAEAAAEEPEWVEVDDTFEAAGDLPQVFNVDHDGSTHLQTIGWFHAAFGFEVNSVPCSIVVVTSPDGERISLTGAMRTWVWTGEVAPTLDQREQLLKSWITVLEAEPRGACAYEGAYTTILWQNASQQSAQPTETDIPTQSEAKPTPSPRRTTAPSPTATPAPIAFEPSELDSILLTNVDLPKEWQPSSSSNLAICWGNAKITAYIAETTLNGDACRLWLVPEGGIPTTIAWFSGVIKGDYPDVDWQVVVQ